MPSPEKEGVVSRRRGLTSESLSAAGSRGRRSPQSSFRRAHRSRCPSPTTRALRRNEHEATSADQLAVPGGGPRADTGPHEPGVSARRERVVVLVVDPVLRETVAVEARPGAEDFLAAAVELQVVIVRSLYRHPAKERRLSDPARGLGTDEQRGARRCTRRRARGAVVPERRSARGVSGDRRRRRRCARRGCRRRARPSL
jgi:hypothetical protein